MAISGEDKLEVEARKSEIQMQLRKHMGLLVDIPMAGCGNTNNGNTARRLFSEPDLAARITGVCETLIYRFSVILRVLASGYEVNTDAFRSYALETAEIFVDRYHWYYMPSSVHRILIHGAVIISHVALPIGLMSEEALEARNEEFRGLGQNHSRKDNRTDTMQDVMNGLLISSDPLITSLSKPSNNSRKDIMLDSVVAGLLTNCKNILIDSDSSDSE